MGEEVSVSYVKDYDNFRTEALERQEGLGEIAEEMATFVLHLEEDGAGRGEALKLVEDYVKHKLGELGKRDVELAEQMFDAKTAAGLQEVLYHESLGNYEEAQRLFNRTMRAAPGGGSCGAGSCGLESVSTAGEQGQQIKDKLNARAGDTITKDTVRSCKNCGEKQLYYAHNASKVNTWCKGCDTVVKKSSYAPVAKADYALAA